MNDLVSRLTLEEKISLIPVRQAAVPRLGIDPYPIGGEAAHGVAWVGKATVFPQPVGLSCTWDRDLLGRIGEVIGVEARAYRDILGTEFGLTLWAPTVDLVRDPRWGRTEEAYGEDPCLASELAGSLVRGMQGDHPFYLRMGATLKHFFANNNETDRGISSSEMHPWLMHNYYLEVFRRIIERARVTCIMTAYNAVNGIPCLIHPAVKRLVKEEWGLPGFVVTDAADFGMTVGMHAYFEDHVESIAATIRSGVDAITEDDRTIVIDSLRHALERGLLKEEDLDTALRNIFRIRFRLGEFDPPDRNPYAGITKDALCAPSHARIAREAAQKSVVLLKNRGLLPLHAHTLKRVAVVGPLAHEVHTDWYSGTLPYVVTPLDALKERLTGAEVWYEEGSSRVRFRSAAYHRWLASDEKGNISLSPPGEIPAAEGLWDWLDWGWGSHTFRSVASRRYLTCAPEGTHLSATAEQVRGWFVQEVFSLEERVGGLYAIRTWHGKYLSCDVSGRVHLSDRADTMRELFELEVVDEGLERVRELAGKADVVLAFCGNNPYINGKETVDRPDLILPPLQQALVRTAFEANPRTALILIGSYPFSIAWEDEHLPAILYSSHGGQEMGRALTDVLLGDVSPAGRLSLTWYRSSSVLSSIFDYQIHKGRRTYWYAREEDVLYPFGYGLSYTECVYTGMECSPSRLTPETELTVKVRVRNVGAVASDEVVQCYLVPPAMGAFSPRKVLVRFDRVHLVPGEERELTWLLAAGDFSFWHPAAGRRIPIPGRWKVQVGSSSRDIHLEEEVTLEASGPPCWTAGTRIPVSLCDDFEGCRFVEGRDLYPALRPSSGATARVRFKKVECAAERREMRLLVRNRGEGAGLRVESGMKSVNIASALPFTGDEWKEVVIPFHFPSGSHDLSISWRGEAEILWIVL
ncbi:glycoside hydrolase family 3 C-terminal domain-containing protein [Spirochaeta thermophila]|uniref:glycoside hydrolase family 3 C-terminal domain-containing protein n=1 Tax=Winmispira thermophila TaxID=154 RepID=UPI0001F0F9A2|nr:glycoside hydrolase family 3 C-terminal domain-containing protein [Spirochaeta thermophila]